MKFLKITIIFSMIFLFSNKIFASDLQVYAEYEVNNLKFTSYSKSWTKEKLKELYIELINNFHGDEFEYLSNIYIYPNSPEGVNGLYYEDVYIENGTYKFGQNSYINLYNGEKYNSVVKIAPILSHEYGHHYVMFNLLRKENIYYNNIKNSKYVEIRNLSSYPNVIYDHYQDNYIYHWDIMELMADDYVQLLGSSNAKLSSQYKSVDELVNENLPTYENPSSFNLKPQTNPYLPLAADVDGLYNYFLSLAGFTMATPKAPEKPIVDKISVTEALNGEPTYNISWINPNTSEMLEYTLVIYPENNPFVAYPLKTFSSNENFNITFGSYSVKDKNGKLKYISQKYEGNYTLKLYIKDKYGFLYSSDTVTYDFTTLNNQLAQSQQTSSNKTTSTTTVQEETVEVASKVFGPSTTGSSKSIFSILKV